MQYYHRWLEINLLTNLESKYCDDFNISVKAVMHTLSRDLKIIH